ncbi:MAG: iron ABC transporter permease [Planctomycetota bacterium]|nr:MAG: iron ABC transporter permease [Planctomycetota bacterium]
MKLQPRNLYVLLSLAWVAVALLSLAVGTCGVSIVGHFTDELYLDIFKRLSLPRLVMGTLAGASLAVAGAMFQSLFRNPLASPYTLGVSSGASLGASIAFTLAGGGLLFGLPIISLAAFAGAMVCVTVVYLIAQMQQARSIGILLLAGITMGFICTALIVVIIFLSKEHDLRHILQWMMGSLETVGAKPVYESLAMIAIAGGFAVYLHRDLDLLMMGQTLAASRGVSVRRSNRLIYFSASLLTAGVVAHCGPIGFVGLIVPHMMRFIVGPIHRHLLPACALAGAVFLPLCDLLARNAMWWLRDESRQVPVGVITNLIGGAFFLYLLLTFRRHRQIS